MSVTVTVTTRPEPRVKTGMMPGLFLDSPGTPDVTGLYAEVDVTVDGQTSTIQVSRLDGETEWTVDAAFRGSFPIFCNGFGARYLRTQVVTPVVATDLDAASVSA